MLGVQPIDTTGVDWRNLVWKPDGSVDPDFTIIRIPVRLESEHFLSNALKEIPNESWSAKYNVSGWQAAYLTSSEPNQFYIDKPEDQLKFTSDGFQGYHAREGGIRKFGSPVFHTIDDFWNHFSKFSIVKPKLSRLLPSTVIKSHIDGPHVVSAFIALSSNSYAGIFVDGVLYRIPEDGFVYLMNASLDHHVFNFGNDIRYHLVFNLYPNDLPSPRELLKKTVNTGEAVPAERNRIIRHTLNRQLLADGGALFSKQLMTDLRSKTVCEFQYFVGQDVIDDGAFGTLIALIGGMSLGYGQAFHLYVSEDQGEKPLVMASKEQQALDYLTKISRSPLAGAKYQANLQAFLSRIHVN